LNRFERFGGLGSLLALRLFFLVWRSHLGWCNWRLGKDLIRLLRLRLLRHSGPYLLHLRDFLEVHEHFLKITHAWCWWSNLFFGTNLLSSYELFSRAFGLRFLLYKAHFFLFGDGLFGFGFR
jgi:hypothetical protein